MSNIDDKQLTYAVTKGSVHVPGIGQFGPTLSLSATGTKVIKMTVSEPVVLIDAKAEGGKVMSLAVPITYFTTMVFAKN